MNNYYSKLRESFKVLALFIELKFFPLFNESNLLWLYLIHKQNSIQVVNFVLKSTGSHLLYLNFNFLSFLVVIMYLYFPRSTYIPSYSWDWQAAFPETLSLFVQYRNFRIDDYRKRKRNKFSIPWTEFRNLDQTKLLCDSYLRGSYAQSIFGLHSNFQIFN